MVGYPGEHYGLETSQSLLLDGAGITRIRDRDDEPYGVAVHATQRIRFGSRIEAGRLAKRLPQADVE